MAPEDGQWGSDSTGSGSRGERPRVLPRARRRICAWHRRRSRRGLSRLEALGWKSRGPCVTPEGARPPVGGRGGDSRLLRLYGDACRSGLCCPLRGQGGAGGRKRRRRGFRGCQGDGETGGERRGELRDGCKRRFLAGMAPPEPPSLCGPPARGAEGAEARRGVFRGPPGGASGRPRWIRKKVPRRAAETAAAPP